MRNLVISENSEYPSARIEQPQSGEDFRVSDAIRVTQAEPAFTQAPNRAPSALGENGELREPEPLVTGIGLCQLCDVPGARSAPLWCDEFDQVTPASNGKSKLGVPRNRRRVLIENVKDDLSARFARTSNRCTEQLPPEMTTTIVRTHRNVVEMDRPGPPFHLRGAHNSIT
nr:hypothetical protein [uncultured Paludibaculum sp.]